MIILALLFIVYLLTLQLQKTTAELNHIKEFTRYKHIHGYIEKCQSKTVVYDSLMILSPSEQMKYYKN